MRTSFVDPALPVAGGKQVVEKKLNVLETILHILNQDGWRAFFHGLGPALILVSNPILQFTLFEQLKNIILKRRSIRLTKAGASAPPLTDLDFFLLGAVSKLFATSITYPYLTVKARMQSQSVEGKSYSSSLDGVRKIIKKEGVSGLYAGIGPKLTQSVATVCFPSIAWREQGRRPPRPNEADAPLFSPNRLPSSSSPRRRSTRPPSRRCRLSQRSRRAPGKDETRDELEETTLCNTIEVPQ